MRPVTKIAWSGALLGAGLMALLDPQRGRRRRALLRDKASRAAGAIGDAACVTWRDLRNRTRGAAAELRTVTGGPPVPDEVLAERVRSRIGRLVSHPGAIEVSASRGIVTLSGPVLETEVDDLVAGVRETRGVQDVESRLETHSEPGRVPALQGGAGRPGRRSVLRENWSPTARLFAAAAGAGLAAYGVKRRGWLGSGLAALGVGLVGRAATNLPASRLSGVRPGRRGIDVRKTVWFDAPVEEVFAFWSNWENVPRFLSHVREVRDDGDGRTHWEVDGPAGATVAWDAVVTAFIPNQLLAWKTVRGAAVRQSGIVRFDSTPDGGTRVDFRLTYRPPAGVLGHGVASLFGTDPETTLDDDVIRLKSLIERGRTPAHGGEARQELAPAEEVSEALSRGEVTPVAVTPAIVTPGEAAPPEPAPATASSEGETEPGGAEPTTGGRRTRRSAEESPERGPRKRDRPRA